MPVYVDPVFVWPSNNPRLRWNKKAEWSHMWADIGDIELLHIIASQIGLKRSWFQNHGTIPHYDLSVKRRELAINAGAIEMSMVEWMKAGRWRLIKKEQR